MKIPLLVGGEHGAPTLGQGGSQEKGRPQDTRVTGGTVQKFSVVRTFPWKEVHRIGDQEQGGTENVAQSNERFEQDGLQALSLLRNRLQGFVAIVQSPGPK